MTFGEQWDAVLEMVNRDTASYGRKAFFSMGNPEYEDVVRGTLMGASYGAVILRDENGYCFGPNAHKDLVRLLRDLEFGTEIEIRCLEQGKRPYKYEVKVLAPA